MNKSMTALISCFVRYYHTKNSNIKIYNDEYAEKMLTKEEINNITKSLEGGINFFNSNYQGNKPLEFIINNYLGPSVLARSKFNENHLLNEINLGLSQYVILASGYDTSAFKVNKRIKVFELDKLEMIEDKLKRIKNSNLNTSNITYIKSDFNNNWIKDLLNTSFDINKKTFCSLLGISYYLEKSVFKNTIKELSNNISKGSLILFDYPNKFESDKERINKKLAVGANEEMKSLYSYNEIETIAESNNMLIYEHLNYKDINNTYFYNYNTINSNNNILATIGISYCILVKQ